MDWSKRSLIKDLLNKQFNEQVIIAGWVSKIRDHGLITFIELRDFSGSIQIVFDKKNLESQIDKTNGLTNEAISDGEAKILDEHTTEHNTSKGLGREFVIKVQGKLIERSDSTKNKEINTGNIEIAGEQIQVISKAKVPPFDVLSDGHDINEDLRHKYRFLDLRRPRLQKMLKTKHNLFKTIRNWFDNNGFCEIQTPLLSASTPEGARDFLVPSRIHQGKFFALPQSPQQFKQLLMISGIDKYYQIAPCFRDEDSRADRHMGEFYQLDIENSFVDRDTFLNRMDLMMSDVFPKITDKKIINLDHLKDTNLFPKSDFTNKFPRLNYLEVQEVFGCDKPDLRFELYHQNITSIMKESQIKIFENAQSVKAIIIQPDKVQKDLLENLKTRKGLDDLNEMAKGIGAKGIASIFVSAISNGAENVNTTSSNDKSNNNVNENLAQTEWQGSIGKVLNQQTKQKLIENLKLKGGEIIFMYGDKANISSRIMDNVRRYVANKLNLIDKNTLALAWVIDFPMFEFNETENKWDFSHNPFSMPHASLQDLKTKDPSEIMAFQYDLVCNGYEILSGSIRNHDIDLFIQAFKVTGYTEEQVKKEFNHIIEAFSYGVPPHGGCAFGLDRLLLILLDEDNIRDSYAFPKNTQGREVMTDSPRPASAKQLKELGLEVKISS